MTVDDLAAPGSAGERQGSPLSGIPRRLVVAWQHPATRLIAPVGLLESDAAGFRFRYLRSAVSVEGFQPFISFPQWDTTYVAAVLFPMFSQRIMNPRRPDYTEYLRTLHLANSSPSPWEVLARSEGRRTGDTVQVFPVPTVDEDGTTTCSFLVHGVRWVLGDAPLVLDAGDRLLLYEEPNNPKNPRAVRVVTVEARAVGYVPDLMLDHLAVMRSNGPIELKAVHVNGPGVPPHLRVLAQIAGSVPADYRPMSGPGWETFSP